MLLRFRLQNHRSVRDETELSLIASSIKDNRGSAVPVDGLNESVLLVIAIYGANASGKSAILNGIRFMDRTVGLSQRGWKPDAPIPREPFRLDDQSSVKPSLFEIDFLVSKVRYQYGFTLDSEKILEEWLYAYPRGRKQLWFERNEAKCQFGKNLRGPNRSVWELTRRNSLFLSAAAQNNHEQLSAIFSWFESKLHFVSAADREMLALRTAHWIRKHGHRDQHLAFLRSADLGVVGATIEESKPDDKTKKLIASVREILEIPGDFDPENLPPEIALLHKAGRKNEPVRLDFESESDGTKAWFGILGPVLHALEVGGVLCVDELDSSLHPLLALELVRTFNDPKRNPRGAQLIFNTHDTNLLDFDALRRDQVWFTEKDEEGATHLYPLTDFKPRTGERLERGYLQGRYGAIPFIGKSLMSGPDARGKTGA